MRTPSLTLLLQVMLLVLSTFCFVSTLSAQASVTDRVNDPARPKVGVVLAGGGARGLAHIKALQVIEESGVPIDLIVGNSMGSIVAGLYAAGYSPAELLQIVENTQWMELLLDNPDYGKSLLSAKKANQNYLLRIALDKEIKSTSVGKGGMIKGRNLLRLFESLTKGLPDSISFNDLSIPFACLATDAVTGQEVDLHSGSLIQSIRASMAIPGAFTPVRMDSLLLVDGFVVNNFPVDLAKKMGADIVIGVDITSDPKTDDMVEQYSNMMDLFTHLLDGYSADLYQRNIAASDIYIPIDATGFSSASFTPDAIDTLLVRGEVAARQKKGELVALHDRLLGADGHVDYDHHMPGVQYNPKAKIDPDTVASLNIGARFDNQEYASVQLRLHQVARTKFNLNMAAEARLGKRLEGSLGLGHYFGRGHIWRVGYQYQHRELDYRHEGHKAATITSHHHRLQAVSSYWAHKFMTTIGLRYDIHRYTDVMLNGQNGSYIMGVQNNEIPIERYFSYVMRTEYNSLDNQAFPTRGSQLQARLDVVTNNLGQWHGEAPIPIVGLYWTTACPLGSRFVLTPQAQGRMVFPGKSETPFGLINVVGGYQRNMVVHHQISMPGLPYLEHVANNAIITAGFGGQLNVTGNHYIDFAVAGGSFTDNHEDLFDADHLTYGFDAGYAMKSFAGPIKLMLHWSEYTHKLQFSVTAGYYF